MKSTTKKLSETKVEVKVTLDGADLKPAREEALNQLAKNVKIQGFRQSKAPASMVEKNVDLTLFPSERSILPYALRWLKAFADEKLNLIAFEKVDVTKFVPDESAEYTAIVEVLPEVKLGDFKKLKAKMEKLSRPPKMFRKLSIISLAPTLRKKAVKRPAKDSDEVIIDFVGKKTEKPLLAVPQRDYHLVLGSNSFIPGFETGIVGHEPGDKFDLNLTFPKRLPLRKALLDKKLFSRCFSNKSTKS